MALRGTGSRSDIVVKENPVQDHERQQRKGNPGGALLVVALLPLVLLALAEGAAQADLGPPEPSRFIPFRDLFGRIWGGDGPSAFEQRAIQEKKPVEEPERPEGETVEGEDVEAAPAEDAGQEPAAGTPPAEPSVAPPPGAPPAAPALGTPAPGTPTPGTPTPGTPAPGTPTGTPPPAKKAILSPAREEAAPSPKSPTRAFLLSAALPGLGELYSGSNKGYLFLGVEAVSWITFASYRSSANNKEDDMFVYADDHFSIGAFEQDCVGQPGQSCPEALTTIQDFYERDRDEYYEIISKNPIYRTGWGIRVLDNGGFVYENCDPDDPPGSCPPEEGTDQYREWKADQAAAQDRQYAQYNGIRDDRNSLSRTARGMTMVALVNHVVSAWDAFMTARGLNAVAHGFKAHVGGQVQMDLKLKGSLGNPGATFVLRRTF